MINIDQIRTKFLDAIKHSGMTQAELANKIGVSQQAIAQYLHQNKMPSLETFANICAVLDLDANDILCVADYKSE